MNNLKKFFEKINPDVTQDWTYLESLVAERTFAKNFIITQQNEVEDYVNFITDGVARIYYDGGSKQTTVNFGFKGEFLTSYHSFLSRTPSKYAIETITDVRLMSISYENLQKIYEDVKVGNYISRKIIEANFLLKEKRELDLLTKTPTEYYLYLLKEHPEYIQQIPLNYLASYIGVTPQALSRIRKKITF